MKTFVPVLALSMALTGCSNNSTSSPQPTSPSQPNAATSSAFNAGGAREGFHGDIAKQTISHKFSLLPTVYAQNTVVLTGTFSGYAAVLDGAAYEGFGIPLPQGSVPIAYPINGVGSYNSTTCINLGPCYLAFANGSMDPGQALASAFGPGVAANGSIAPAPVTGAGTLGPLVVYAYPTNGAVPPPPLSTDLIEVWVIRRGQVLNSGIACSLPVEIGSNLSQQRCESSSTFAVQDGDGIIATITLNPADQVSSLAFFLVKS